MVERVYEGAGAGMSDELHHLIIAKQIIDSGTKKTPFSAQQDIWRAHYLQLRQAVLSGDYPPVQLVQIMFCHDDIPSGDRSEVLVFGPAARPQSHER